MTLQLGVTLLVMDVVLTGGADVLAMSQLLWHRTSETSAARGAGLGVANRAGVTCRPMDRATVRVAGIAWRLGVKLLHKAAPRTRIKPSSDRADRKTSFFKTPVTRMEVCR